MEKRGQVTVFIILGILILIMGGLYFYLRKEAAEVMGERARPQLSEVPVALAPIRQFIASCAEQTGKEALKLLGERGGFIKPRGTFNPFEPTESDGIAMTLDGSLSVPYWWYLKDRNRCEGTCEFASNKPALYKEQGANSVEEQIEKYVEENIDDCFQRFIPLREQGYIIREKEPLKVETSIGFDSAYVLIKYPLIVKKDDVALEFDEALGELDVNLGEIFEAASEISQLQSEHGFLEQHTKNVIDAFSGLDKNYLPPISDMRFKFGSSIIWVKYQVMETLRKLLTTYVPLLQVFGTRNYRLIDSPPSYTGDKQLFRVLYNRGMLVPLNMTHPLLEVNMQYLDWWKPFVDLNCKGQICRGEATSNTLLFLFGIQRYHFAYDVSFPVLVTIRNPFAFKGEGYNFQFALEANMRNNRFMTSTFDPLKTPPTLFGSMVCDPDKMNSENVSVLVIDGRTRRPTEAEILYSCGREACPIGTAENGKLTAKYPICIGGVLSAEQQDYHPTFAAMDTDSPVPQNKTIAIEPYRFMNVKIKFYRLAPKFGEVNRWVINTDDALDIERDEEVLITLEREGNDFEEPFTSFASIIGDKFSAEEQFNTNVRMIPGTYKVSIFGIKRPYPPLIIPREKIQMSQDSALGFGTGKPVVLPEVKFDKKNPFPYAGAEFTWQVTSEMLDKGDTIVFKAIRFGLDKLPEADRTLSDLDQLAQYKDYSLLYRTHLEPLIIEEK